MPGGGSDLTGLKLKCLVLDILYVTELIILYSKWILADSTFLQNMLRYVKARADEKRGLTRLKQPSNLPNPAQREGLTPRADPTCSLCPEIPEDY